MNITHLAYTVTLAALLGTSAIGQVVSDEEGTLTVYMRDSSGFVAAAEDTLEKFNAMYPNVEVEIRYNSANNGGWGEYANKFLNQVAAGDGADVIEVAIEGFETIAARGILADLGPLMDSNAELQTLSADIAPGLLNAMRSPTSGELNFLPLEWNNSVVYYNMDHFDAAGLDYPQNGWTWDEFLETAQALTKRDGDTTSQYGYRIPGHNFLLSAWFLTNGTEKLTPDWTESNVTDPAFGESLAFLHALIHEHGVSPTYEDGHGRDQFIAGQASMFSCGHWCLPPMRDQGMRVGVVMPPVPNAGDPLATVAGIGGIGVLKDSPNRDLALTWVQLFAGGDFQKTIAEDFGAIPASRTWANSAEYLAYPENAEVFYLSADHVTPVVSPANFAQVSDIFMRNMSAYMTGSANLEDTISEMDSELTRAMRRVR